MGNNLGIMKDYGGLILSMALIFYGLLFSYLQHQFNTENEEY